MQPEEWREISILCRITRRSCQPKRSGRRLSSLEEIGRSQPALPAGDGSLEVVEKTPRVVVPPGPRVHRAWSFIDAEARQIALGHLDAPIARRREAVASRPSERRTRLAHWPEPSDLVPICGLCPDTFHHRIFTDNDRESPRIGQNRSVSTKFVEAGKPMCRWEITGLACVLRERPKTNPLVAGSSPARPTSVAFFKIEIMNSTVIHRLSGLVRVAWPVARPRVPL